MRHPDAAQAFPDLPQKLRLSTKANACSSFAPVYPYTPLQTCRCPYIYIYMCIHTYVLHYAYVCIYIYIYICMYVCIYIYIYIYILSSPLLALFADLGCFLGRKAVHSEKRLGQTIKGSTNDHYRHHMNNNNNY